MKGLHILTHSVRQVFGNLEMALRVSAVLFLVSWAVRAAVGLSYFTDQTFSQNQISSGLFPWGPYFGSLIVTIFISLWVAVGWHRYVLTSEPVGIIPKFHGPQIAKYFWKGLLIGLVIGIPVGIVMAIFLAAIATLAPGGVAAFGPLLGWIILIPFFAFAQRLSVVLPGIALGRDFSIFDGLTKTKGELAPFVVLSALILALNIVLTTAIPSLLGGLEMFQIGWSFVAEWFVIMVSVSVLTTLYGHYVEGRPLV